MSFTRRECRAVARLVLPLLVGCGEPATQGGVKPEAWQLFPEPIMTIGQAEGDPPYLFSQIAQVALLPDGRVAVADRDADGIRLFRSDGTFDREIGGRGEGPGEFEDVSKLVALPPDTLLVHDGGLFRLSRFLTDGTLLSTLALHASDGSPEIYLGSFSTGEYGFGWIRIERRDHSRPVPDVMRVARFGADGRMTALLRTTTGMVRFGSSPLAFSPHLWVEMIGDSLFVTDGLPPVIEVWDSKGRLVRTMAVAVPPLDVATAWKALEVEIRNKGDRWQVGWFEEQPRAVEIPGISRMLLDDQQRLWVKLYDPSTDSHFLQFARSGGEWWILRPDGTVLATIQLPAGFRLSDVRNDHLVGVTRDELGVERVQVFTFARPRGAT